MRWRTAVAAAITIVCSTLTAATAQTALVPGGLTERAAVHALGPNLVQNGEFEAAAGSLPAGWTANTAWSLDPVVVHGGAASMRLTDAATTATFFASQPLTLQKGRYKLSGWIRTQDLGLNASNAGVRLSLDFSVAGSLDRGLSTIVRGTTEWTYYEVSDIVVPEDRPASIKLEAYARPGGLAWFDDVKVERQVPSPVDVFMLYPNYRGMLFDDQAPTMRFAVVVNPPVDDFARYAVVARLAEEGGAELLAREFAASASFTAELDGSLMTPGASHLVTFSLVDRSNGATVYTYPAYRVSKPAGTARDGMNIAVDEKNRLLVHGRPRFLLGVYDSGMGYGTTDAYWDDALWSPTGTRRMDGLRINFYLNYWYGAANAGAMHSLMANLDKRDVMYLQTGNCFNTRPASQNSFLIDTSDAYVQDIGADPRLAGYYTIDECVPALVPGAFTQYQRLRLLDPDSMTFAALLPEADVVLWRDATDVISTDPYPMYGAEPATGYRHHLVADAARLTRETVHDARPWVTVLQFFKFTSQGRWPTLAEMRSHAYMAIVEGTHGLWWWSLGTGALKDVCAGWCDQKTALMNQLKTVVNEIADLEPVLLSDDTAGALVSVSDPANIRTKVKVVDGKGYVFAYNYANATVPATFTWHTAPGGITVNAESRTLVPAGQTFTDTFGPYQAHVYVIENGVPPLAGAFAAPDEGASLTSTATVGMTSTGGLIGPRTFTLTFAGPTAIAPVTQTVSGASAAYAWDTKAVGNGVYTLGMSVTDGRTTVSAQRTVTVANLSGGFAAPADGATVTGTAAIDMTSAGGVGGGRTFALTFAGPTAVTPVTQTVAGTTASYAWNTVGVTNGTYTIALAITDAAGSTATAQRSVTVDNIPPLTAGFTTPAAGASVTGTVPVGMTSAGGTNGTRTFTLGFTGPSAVAPVTQTVTGTSASYAWNTTGLTNGAYTLSLTVTDAAGVVATAQRTVTLANPVATFTAAFTNPAADATVRNNLSVGMSTTAPWGQAKTFTLSVDGRQIATQPTTGTTWWHTLDTRTLANGAHTLAVAVTHNGATATATRAITVANGSTKTSQLAASFTSPAASATVSGTTTVGMASSGGTGTSRTFRLELVQNGTTTLLSAQTVTGTAASYAWNTGAAANGDATLRLTVGDGTTSVTTTRAVTVANATASFAASFSSPAEGAIESDNASIGMATTAPWGQSKAFTLAIDGGVVLTRTITGTTLWHVVDTNTLTNGAHTLTLTVTHNGQTARATRTLTVRN